jgi:TonB family protein
MRTEPQNVGMMFAGLPAPPRKRWKHFGYGLLSQAVLLAVLIQVGLIQPAKIVRNTKSYVLTLAVPVPVPHEVQKPRAMVRPPKIVLKDMPKLVEAKIPPAPVKIESPKFDAPKIEAKAPVAPKAIVSQKPVFETATVAKVEPKPGPLVKTGDFGSSGSSAKATSDLQAKQVQTGGFGDPNGIAAKNTSNGPANIAKAGGFDMPQGEGYGNGTGGKNGTRALVASAGFGNGTAAPGGGGHGTGGVVRTVGFDSTPVASAPRTRAVAEPESTSPQVLSKPTPVYTAEARAMKLEGEVLLEVVFSASGKIEVKRVVRGLGHGLDEAAIRAAEQIKYKPATRGGAPVDSTATLHIVFQLA